MAAGNLFITRSKAFVLRTKAVNTTYTVRVGGSGYNHIKDRVITVTDPTANFTITIPDGVYEGQQLLITFLSDANNVTVTVYKSTPGAPINLTTAGDFASLEWVNDDAGWVVLAYEST